MGQEEQPQTEGLVVSTEQLSGLPEPGGWVAVGGRLRLGSGGGEGTELTDIVLKSVYTD